ncbi:MAG: hypothetical protein E7K67_10170, partial [Peptostreptococcaceae bacterium]|nr:hypothetical protein [Peptostreptococcaceae bacterium]
MSKRKQVQVPIEKIQEQDRFIEAIAEKNSRFYAIHQTKPKYMIQTLALFDVLHKILNFFQLLLL